MNCSGVLLNEKSIGLNVFKGTILKKINVSSSVHFCFGKYSFSLDTFWTQHVSTCSNAC